MHPASTSKELSARFKTTSSSTSICCRCCLVKAYHFQFLVDLFRFNLRKSHKARCVAGYGIHSELCHGSARWNQPTIRVRKEAKHICKNISWKTFKSSYTHMRLLSIQRAIRELVHVKSISQMSWTTGVVKKKNPSQMIKMAQLIICSQNSVPIDVPSTPIIKGV